MCVFAQIEHLTDIYRDFTRGAAVTNNEIKTSKDFEACVVWCSQEIDNASCSR